MANALIFVHFFSVPARLQKINFRETGLDMTFSVIEINATQFEKRRIDFKSDDFAAVCVVNAKVHS